MTRKTSSKRATDPKSVQDNAPRAIGIDGRRYRTVNSNSTLPVHSMATLSLATPTRTIVCPASMPNAEPGYAWLHLATPPRQIGR